ncbi:MAG: response regulator [Ignavibacteria bacterium]
MRALIVDDEFLNRFILEKMVSAYFELDMATNGEEAVSAFALANSAGNPYQVIFLDIMMPVMDGIEALMKIREIETSLGRVPSEEVKVIMTTALDTPQHVLDAFFKGGCSAYVIKPVEKIKILDELKKQGLI